MTAINPVEVRISRRRLLQTLSLGSAGVALTGPAPVYAKQGPATRETSPAIAPLNRFPRMVQEFFVARENEIYQQRLKRLAALKTKADAQAYVESVRGQIRQAFGPYPEKTPLNAR